MTRARTNNQKLVRSLFAKLKIKEPPTPLNKVAKYLGYQIQTLDFPSDFDGVNLSKKGGGLIGVNANHHLNRQRFTVAHELAHFMKGHTISQSKLNNYTTRAAADIYNHEDIQEREANFLASELLIPRHFLERDALAHTIDELYKKYLVSKQAMIIKLQRANLHPKSE